jgi:hypothetical protein
LNDVLLIGALVAFATAILSAVLIRSRDFVAVEAPAQEQVQEPEAAAVAA